MSLSVVFIELYFICRKSSHGLLLKFVSVTEDIVLIEIMKRQSHLARLRENELSFRYRAWFEGNLLRFVRARADMRAKMSRKSCALEMRNTILGNHHKVIPMK